jgi:hypothetical protein
MLIVSWNVASWPTTVRCIQGELSRDFLMLPC